jgi:hypothetical protein
MTAGPQTTDTFVEMADTWQDDLIGAKEFFALPGNAYVRREALQCVHN